MRALNIATVAVQALVEEPPAQAGAALPDPCSPLRGHQRLRSVTIISYFQSSTEVAGDRMLGGVKSTPIARWLSTKTCNDVSKDAVGGVSTGSGVIDLGYDDP